MDKLKLKKYLKLKAQRKSNRLLLGASHKMRHFFQGIVLGMPANCSIEPTNYCNAKCILCPTGNGTLKRTQGYMSLPVFHKFIDEIGSTLEHIAFFNYGEPFLNESIFEMIKYASENFISTTVSTNGFVFYDRENIPNIIISGLEHLILSVDGASDETLKKYRVTPDFKKIMEGLKHLIQRKRKFNLKTPIIEWQFIVHKFNEHEISDAKKIAKDAGVDRFHLKTLSLHMSEDGVQKKDWLPDNTDFWRYRDNSLSYRNPIRNDCNWLWNSTVLNWDGLVTPCCFDYEGAYSMGNINDAPFRKIWNNEKYRNLRKKIMIQRSKLPLCDTCSEGQEIFASREII